MTPRRRPLLPALAARGLGAVVALLALVTMAVLVPAPAHAGPPPGGSAEPDDVFTATIERVEREPGPVGRPTRSTYVVQVQEVYGESDISSVRVRVQTSAAFAQCETRPVSKGPALYLWKLTRQGTRLVADGCRDVLRASDVRRAEMIAAYGQPRSPIEQQPSEQPAPFEPVTYTCPGSSQTLTDVAGAERVCADIAEPVSFDRAAAPGLALVLVGILGWIVVLRLARRRRT